MYNDERNFDQYPPWSPYGASFGSQQQPPPLVKYMSTSRLDHIGSSQPYPPERPYSAHAFDTYQRQMHQSSFLASQSYLPTDPWPSKSIICLSNVFKSYRLIEEKKITILIIFKRQSL